MNPILNYLTQPVPRYVVLTATVFSSIRAAHYKAEAKRVHENNKTLVDSANRVVNLAKDYVPQTVLNQMNSEIEFANIIVKNNKGQ